jgi:hypothetical protein
MDYAFLLWPHANTRYVASLRKLAYQELHCMLRSCGIPAEISWKDLGGAPWLHVSCSSLPSSALRLISGHSSIYMGATLESGLLRPLEYKVPDYLPPDMAEVLKYKGKTNASFTGLMLNCALCASAFVQAQEPLFIMDPMCGKATGLFCAITRGHNAIGIEIDGKDVQEAGDYISRYLQLHRIKHKVNQGSMTLPGGKSAPFTAWQLADSNEHYQAGDTRTLKLIQGDTLYSSAMQKKQSIHLMIADLPYGVQHAPRQDQHMDGFLPLMKKVLPGWHQVLKPGGAIALSFNTYTLKKADITNELHNAGFAVLNEAPYDDFEHWVEQAVQRDLVVAVKE